VLSALFPLFYKLAGKRPPLPLQRQSGFWPLTGCYGYLDPAGANLLPAELSVFSSVLWQTAPWQSLLQDRTDSALAAGDKQLKGAVIDARHCKQVSQLSGLMQQVQAMLSVLAPQSAIVLLTNSAVSEPEQAACQSAVTGFCRSLAKEVGGLACRVNLIDLAGAALSQAVASVAFLLGPASVYVSGQVLQLAAEAAVQTMVEQEPVIPEPVMAETKALALQGQVALVTGASRGIGLAIATELARQGALVVGLDLPAAKTQLDALMTKLGGQSLVLDLTAADAASQLMDELNQRQLTLSLVVHNAGITRDKTLKRMKLSDWELVLQVNLAAQLRLNAQLLQSDLLQRHCRFISLSSINGLAGQRGQTNYASAKSALSGYMQRMAELYPQHRFNAVAPGFIRTDMTKAMPWMIREIGQRFNSLGQAGEPEDVAAVVAFLARRDCAMQGQIIRVCGQNLLGA